MNRHYGMAMLAGAALFLGAGTSLAQFEPPTSFSGHVWAGLAAGTSCRSGLA